MDMIVQIQVTKLLTYCISSHEAPMALEIS